MERVIAYFMHESEQAAALALLAHPEVTDSFVIGDVDEARIPQLEAHGLVVQRSAAAREPVVQPPASSPRLLDADRGFTTAAMFDDAFPQPEDYYYVWLQGPLTETMRGALATAGVSLLECTAPGVYKARLNTPQRQQLQHLPGVAKVQWVSPTYAAPLTQTRSVRAGGQPVGGVKMLTYDVRVHEPGDRQPIEDFLRAQNIVIAGTGQRKIRFYAAEDAPVLVELSRRPEVSTVAEFVTPRLYNDHARRLLAIDPQSGQSTLPLFAQDGKGQIVGVADTGVDQAHPDLSNRIAGVVARGRRNDSSDPHGHGTHVAGSVLGDGSASNGLIRGVAPGARLFFQSLLDNKGELGGLPVDLNDLFDEAYQAGVRIHNNSWGADTPSYYTVSSEEVDEYVHQHRDMLIVIAAGNAGTSGVAPRRATPGYVDWLSIGSPASCKNALTVGASRSDRRNGALSQDTWAAAWPSDFPTPPIAHDTISGDPECLAAFSSRGPCDDRRIKPDVVAPGTDILSTKSSLAPISNFWGPYPAQGVPKDPHYAFDGGTSMAAPLVSGCAALVRQYYVENGHREPSAALLKATLINSTRWLNGHDSTAATAGKPNYHQGHGRVSMMHAIPNPAVPGLELRFVDEWRTFQFMYTGQRKRYSFVLPAMVPELRVCLAYTDAPGRSLQNNLNLLVHYQDGNRKYLGNEQLPDALTLPDPDNNVECIRLENAAAGTYFIQVAATNLLHPPQDFALVITGIGLPALTEL